jgi:hypothetical protein
MLRRSRVGTTPDLTRISAGVSRPGIDPRTWVSFGYTLAESSIDKDHGHYVEVKLLPSELELTCRVPSEYAGKQFGSHEGLLHQHDEVVVLIPDGDPNHGGILVSRLWSNNDPPPDLVANNPKDIVRVLETDINWRLTLQGSGKAVVTSTEIHLGEEDSTEKLVLGSTYRDKQKTLDDSLKSQFGNLSTALSQLNTAFSTYQSTATYAGLLLPPAALLMKAATTAFCTAAGTAVSAAQTAVDGLKSAVSDFEAAGGSNQDYLSNVATVRK